MIGVIVLVVHVRHVHTIAPPPHPSAAASACRPPSSSPSADHHSRHPVTKTIDRAAIVNMPNRHRRAPPNHGRKIPPPTVGLDTDPCDAAATVSAETMRALYPRWRSRNFRVVCVAHDKPLRPTGQLKLICATDHRELVRLGRVQRPGVVLIPVLATGSCGFWAYPRIRASDVPCNSRTASPEPARAPPNQ
jgi:hypothetical protein